MHAIGEQAKADGGWHRARHRDRYRNGAEMTRGFSGQRQWTAAAGGSFSCQRTRERQNTSGGEATVGTTREGGKG